MATSKPAAIKKPASRELVLTLSREIYDAVERVTRQAAERIKALEARVTKLESLPAMVASGHRDGDRYLPGAYVERNGALFRCTRATREKPGQSDHCAAVTAIKVHMPYRTGS